MNSSEILVQIKRLQAGIDKAMNELEKDNNTPFFQSLLKQNAIDLYNYACFLTDASLSDKNNTVIPPKKQDIAIEISKTISHSDPVQMNGMEEIETEMVVKPVQIAKPKTVLKEVIKETDEDISINDRISKNKQTVLNYADKSKETPISDLSKAISIGKKFEFINGLFEGNSEAYKNSIQTIQNFTSYEEATQYLENSVLIPYHWNENENLATEFFALLKRRFNP